MASLYSEKQCKNGETAVDTCQPLLLNGARVLYTLDVETIRQVMLKHKGTGALHADLPAGVRGIRDTCHVEITLKTGEMVSCSITSQQGFLLTGDKAYQELARLGRIHWTFVPASPPIARPGPSPRSSEASFASHPRRIVVVEELQMRSWPSGHKYVYGLADGTRSIAEIAEQLSTTSEAIETILRDLRSIRVISME